MFVCIYKIGRKDFLKRDGGEKNFYLRAWGNRYRGNKQTSTLLFWGWGAPWVIHEGGGQIFHATQINGT